MLMGSGVFCCLIETCLSAFKKVFLLEAPCFIVAWLSMRILFIVQNRLHFHCGNGFLAPTIPQTPSRKYAARQHLHPLTESVKAKTREHTIIENTHFLHIFNTPFCALSFNFFALRNKSRPDLSAAEKKSTRSRLLCVHNAHIGDKSLGAPRTHI